MNYRRNVEVHCTMCEGVGLGDTGLCTSAGDTWWQCGQCTVCEGVVSGQCGQCTVCEGVGLGDAGLCTSARDTWWQRVLNRNHCSSHSLWHL